MPSVAAEHATHIGRSNLTAEQTTFIELSLSHKTASLEKDSRSPTQIYGVSAGWVEDSVPKKNKKKHTSGKKIQT
jgi:hypothetical protein